MEKMPSITEASDAESQLMQAGIDAEIAMLQLGIEVYTKEVSELIVEISHAQHQLDTSLASSKWTLKQGIRPDINRQLLQEIVDGLLQADPDEFEGHLQNLQSLNISLARQQLRSGFAAT